MDLSGGWLTRPCVWLMRPERAGVEMVRQGPEFWPLAGKFGGEVLSERVYCG
jgi:hypothetical protein